MVLRCCLVWPFVFAIFSHIGALRPGKANKKGFSTIVIDVAMLPGDEWFEQRLDHFDPTNNSTWKQTNDTFFDDPRNGPVFLMIAGEGEARPEWVYQGSMMTMYAVKYRALCFQLEHRFYGKSHPTKDMSTENLKYLNSEQALADLAYFIQGMTVSYGLTDSNKWFVFGGSYPGSLAAWMRLKYPHLVYGAVSMSAPLLAMADFKEYNKVVEANLAKHSLDCIFQLKLAIRLFNKLIRSTSGQDLITQKFHLCSQFNASNYDDALTLAAYLSENIVDTVQYNNDNRFTRDPTANITIGDICNIMTNHSIGGPIDRYAALSNLFLTLRRMDCMNYTFKYMTDELKVDQWNETQTDGDRQWNYQTCTEFGFYQTSTTENELFGATFSLAYYEKQCRTIFGDKFNGNTLNTGIQSTNRRYGQLDIDVNRVIFVQGSADPWHTLGITKTRSWRSPAIFIKGAAHCAALYEPHPNDSPGLVEAREQISILLGYWLMESQNSS